MKKQDYDMPPLMPSLRFPEFKQTGAWELKELSNFLTESRIEGSSGDVAKKITVKLWGKGAVAKEESIKGSENTRYYKRRSGQFIYSKLDFLNQAFDILPNELDGFESTIDLPCFDISKELDPFFLLEYVKREEFFKKNGEIADGGRKAKRIQSETFRSFSIALPPQITEQKKIADFLRSFDERIETEKQKLDALTEHRKGLMQSLLPVEGSILPVLRFPDFKKDKQWVEAKLEDLTNRGSGHTPSKSKPEYYNGGIKWVSLADSKRLDNGLIAETSIEISEQGIKNSSAVRHPAGTVILSRDAGVGKSAILACSMAVSQHFIAWTCKPEQLSNWFLYHTLQNKKPIFERIANGNTIKTIGLPFFIELRISVPPTLLEQQKIADCLSSLDDLIAAQKLKIEAINTYKKGLLQKLFPTLDKVSA